MKNRRSRALPAAATFLFSVATLPVVAPAQDMLPGGAPPVRASTLISADRGVAQEWEFHRRSTSPKYRPIYASTFDVNFSYFGYCPSQPYFLSRCPSYGNYSAISASKRYALP